MATSPLIRIVPPYTPELLESAQKFISEWVWGRKYDPVRVLEFGSGWSTIWFASMGCVIDSVEHSRDWHNEVMSVMLELQFETEYRVYLEQPYKFVNLFDFWRDEHYDIVYVDCIDEMRLEVAKLSLRKLKYGGILILDDTHWPLWEPFLTEMAKSKHYKLLDVFNGLHKRKDGQEYYHQTTIIEKVK